jgi:hypothetical protein
MNGSNTARKLQQISSTEIEAFIARRDALDGLRKRYDLMEASVRATEAGLIEAFQSGADIPHGYDVQVRTTEWKYPSWKSHFASICGAEGTARVLSETAPTVYKSLIVKQAKSDMRKNTKEKIFALLSTLHRWKSQGLARHIGPNPR